MMPPPTTTTAARSRTGSPSAGPGRGGAAAVLPDAEGHVLGRPADQLPDAVGGQPVAPRFRPGHHLVDARRAREDGVRLARRARIAAVVLEVEIQGASEIPVVGVEAVPDEG